MAVVKDSNSVSANSLPSELIRNIVTLLTPDDLKTVALINRQWSEEASAQLLCNVVVLPQQNAPVISANVAGHQRYSDPAMARAECVAMRASTRLLRHVRSVIFDYNSFVFHDPLRRATPQTLADDFAKLLQEAKQLVSIRFIPAYWESDAGVWRRAFEQNLSAEALGNVTEVAIGPWGDCILAYCRNVEKVAAYTKFLGPTGADGIRDSVVSMLEAAGGCMKLERLELQAQWSDVYFKCVGNHLASIPGLKHLALLGKFSGKGIWSTELSAALTKLRSLLTLTIPSASSIAMIERPFPVRSQYDTEPRPQLDLLCDAFARYSLLIAAAGSTEPLAPRQYLRRNPYDHENVAGADAIRNRYESYNAVCIAAFEVLEKVVHQQHAFILYSESHRSWNEPHMKVSRPRSGNVEISRSATDEEVGIMRPKKTRRGGKFGDKRNMAMTG